MSGVFSAISGVFGRAMIIGALLPATLFVLFLHLVLVPMLPWEWALVARLDAFEPRWAAVAALAVVLAGLLSVLNIPIVRLYEGYPWKDGAIGRLLTKWQEAVYADKQARSTRALVLYHDIGDAELEKKLSKISDTVVREAMEVYPLQDSILPTRLGNIIRSFEQYPWQQYRIAGVALWPRFYSRLNDAHAKAVEEARTSFNVTIHLSFLSLVAMLLMLAAGCIYPIPFATPALAAVWLFRLFVAGALAWLFYVASLNTAAAWGHVVRAAFDLHRKEVLRDFGVDPLPRDLQSERAIWDLLSTQVLYGSSDAQANLRFDTSTMTLPAKERLAVTRSVIPISGTAIHIVVVHVENKGGHVDDVQVVQYLPGGTELVWGSATVHVHGTNPYYFSLGAMTSGASQMIKYEILLGKS